MGGIGLDGSTTIICLGQNTALTNQKAGFDLGFFLYRIWRINIGILRLNGIGDIDILQHTIALHLRVVGERFAGSSGFGVLRVIAFASVRLILVVAALFVEERPESVFLHHGAVVLAYLFIKHGLGSLVVETSHRLSGHLPPVAVNQDKHTVQVNTLEVEDRTGSICLCIGIIIHTDGLEPVVCLLVFLTAGTGP